MSPLVILNDEGVKAWGAIFKDGYIPIRSALPSNGVPRYGPSEQKIYLLDEKRLTPEQMQAVTDHPAIKFFVPSRHVKEAFIKGVPIRESLTKGVIIEDSLDTSLLLKAGLLEEDEPLEDELDDLDEDVDEDADDYDETEEEKE